MYDLVRYATVLKSLVKELKCGILSSGLEIVWPYHKLKFTMIPKI